MIRSHRTLLAALLSLLLLGMQQEGLRHALMHWTLALADGQQQSLRPPVDIPCIECSLLSAGTDAAASTPHLLAVASIVPMLVFWVSRPSSPSVPSYYQSRAPPSPL